MKKILIIGANSTIAKDCSKIWAESKSCFYLVARNKKDLKKISINLFKIGAKKVYQFSTDLNNFSKHEHIINSAIKVLGKIDIVLIAHGLLSNQKKCESDLSETLRSIKTNALSTINLLTLLSNYFEKKKYGKIIVLSSVAGDRGRSSNYVYGSSKALLSTFVEGMQQRLYKSKVLLIHFKLGFVDTNMTRKIKKNFLWSSSRYVSKKITQSINKNKLEIYTPFFWKYIMLIIKFIPNFIYKKLSL